MMSAHLDYSPVSFFDYAATHSRFPFSKIGSSLLATIQSSKVGVIITDAARHIVLVNREAERMFGYSAKQLLNKSVALLLPSHTTDQSQRLKKASFPQDPRKRMRQELKGIRSSGEEFSVSVCLSRIIVHGEIFLVTILQNLNTPPTGSQRERQTPRLSELKRLAVSSQQANEVEKKRFSKELYDDIGQRLSVLKLDLDWLEHSLPPIDAGLPARVAQMQNILDKVITLTKSMASTLRPPLLDDFGLMAAVKWITGNFQKKNGIKCILKTDNMKAKLDTSIETAIFRVIQEGLLNIERHAQARNVEVFLEHHHQLLNVMILDDGIGMEPGCENKPGCYGLIAMQERIVVLGGTIFIENTQPRGVMIYISLPIKPLPVQ